MRYTGEEIGTLTNLKRPLRKLAHGFLSPPTPLVFLLLLLLFLNARQAGWGENYEREWDMLTNCMGMAFEEDKIMRVKIAKFEQDLQVLKLEVGLHCCCCCCCGSISSADSTPLAPTVHSV